MNGSPTEAERLRNKIIGIELAIELEQVIVDYLKPSLDEWDSRKGPYSSEIHHRVRQHSTSRGAIINWKVELEDYKKLLLIAEIAPNEPLSQTS